MSIVLIYVQLFHWFVFVLSLPTLFTTFYSVFSKRQMYYLKTGIKENNQYYLGPTSDLSYSFLFYLNIAYHTKSNGRTILVTNCSL